MIIIILFEFIFSLYIFIFIFIYLNNIISFLIIIKDIIFVIINYAFKYMFFSFLFCTETQFYYDSNFIHTFEHVCKFVTIIHIIYTLYKISEISIHIIAISFFICDQYFTFKKFSYYFYNYIQIYFNIINYMN